MIHANDLVLTPVNPNPTLVSRKKTGKKTKDRSKKKKFRKNTLDSQKSVDLFSSRDWLHSIAAAIASGARTFAELVLVLDQGREGRTDDNTDDNIQNLRVDNKLITMGWRGKRTMDEELENVTQGNHLEEQEQRSDVDEIWKCKRKFIRNVKKQDE